MKRHKVAHLFIKLHLCNDQILWNYFIVKKSKKTRPIKAGTMPSEFSAAIIAQQIQHFFKRHNDAHLHISYIYVMIEYC